MARPRDEGPDNRDQVRADSSAAPEEAPSVTFTPSERKQLEAEMEFEEAAKELREARLRLQQAEKRWRVASKRTGRRVPGTSGRARSAPATARTRIGARVLLAAVAFWPLLVTLLPDDMGRGAGRDVVTYFGLIGVAFLFLTICPRFEEELHIDPKGRAVQALLGVALGAAFGLGRVVLSEYGPWGATGSCRALIDSLAGARVGPVLGLLEMLPLLLLVGTVEAIIYGGMLRWVVSTPRGPFPPWAAVVLSAAAFGWLQLCVPRLGDWSFAGLGLVNGAVIAFATWATASPLFAGAFLGVQWWVCLASIYAHLN
jgi:hypothetical protein